MTFLVPHSIKFKFGVKSLCKMYSADISLLSSKDYIGFYIEVKYAIGIILSGFVKIILRKKGIAVDWFKLLTRSGNSDFSIDFGLGWWLKTELLWKFAWSREGFYKKTYSEMWKQLITWRLTIFWRKKTAKQAPWSTTKERRHMVKEKKTDFVWFLCLIVYSWVIECQSNPCRRTIILLFNS